MDFDALFRAFVEQRGSDMFLKGGSRPQMRVGGRLVTCHDEPLEPAVLAQFADELMGPDRWQILESQRELNFAFERAGIGRFRANVLWQQGGLSMVIRRVNNQVFDFEAWRLPGVVLKGLAAERQGLVLVTGPTGNGKSTTISTIIDHINRTEPCHIVTLEDPIEYQFEEKQAVINQREVGVDTLSFTEGLRNLLRQNPDVLYISDLRNQETMESAMLAAESGQLVLSCIHTTNVMTTIERVLAFYPPHEQATVRFRLSLVLKGIISLRLLPRSDGKGRVPACEIMVATPTIRELIRELKLEDIPQLIHDGKMYGMQTQTQALYELVSAGHVTLDEALKIADHPAELELALREIRGTKDAVWAGRST